MQIINNLFSNYYRTIIFDCDGVILDSNELKTDSFIQLLDNQPKKIINTFISYHKKNGGITRQKKIEFLLKNIIKNYSIERHQNLVDKYGEIVSNNFKNVQFTKCAEAFIKKHHVSKKLYVVSGGKQSELHNIFQNLKIFDYFNFIYGNPLSKVENMKKLFSEFNIEKEILFIGDSKVDFDVAKKFNIDFLFVKDYSEMVNHNSFLDKYKISSVNNFSNLV